MADRKTLEFYLYAHEGNECAMPLTEAVAWLQGLLESVPAECRETARFRTALSYGVYDDPTELEFEVTYSRLETEEEADAREAEDARRKEESKRYEIARLRSNLERLTNPSPD